MEQNTLIMMKGSEVRVISQLRELNYSQNDTVILLMDGKCEVIDKETFRAMLLSCSNRLADSLLHNYELLRKIRDEKRSK